MPDRIQILAIGVSAAFLILVLELVRRRKLVEEYSFLWIVVAVLVLAVSIWRELLHTAARDLGVHDPPNVLLIALTAAVLVRRRERIEVIETEAAHIGFAPLNEDEQAIADDLAGRYGRASVERIVSGPGLIDLYRHFGGCDWDVGDSGGLWSAAIQGDDPLAAQALDAFVKCFGSAAGDIALAHGANAMVITGGLANRIADRLRSPLFRGRFIAKGRYRERMERVKVRLATMEEPGLLGAAVAFQREWPT